MTISKIISAKGVGAVTLDTTGCDRIVVAQGSLGYVTFTDNKNSFAGYTKLTDKQDGGATNCCLHYHESPTCGTSHTFTSSQAFAAIVVIGFTGWKASAAFDGENGAILASAALTLQPGSLTPSENDCLLVAAMATGGDPTGSTPSGWSYDSTTLQIGINGTNYGLAVAYKIQGTAGAENPTFSHTPSAIAASVIAAFKSDGIGGGGGGLAMPPRRAFPMSILNH